MIESSLSIKCPCIEYHLIGTKKIQQVLADPKGNSFLSKVLIVIGAELERFLSLKDSLLLQECFVGLWPLDNTPLGLQGYELALKDPLKYVMKPQREGGGNNIYGADIPPLLNSLSLQDRSSFILMELIQPPSLNNVMLRKGEIIQSDVVSELGIYGIWVSDGDVCHLNESGGHLLRTKTVNSNEGGVAAGYAVIDSPLLI